MRVRWDIILLGVALASSASVSWRSNVATDWLLTGVFAIALIQQVISKPVRPRWSSRGEMWQFRARLWLIVLVGAMGLSVVTDLLLVGALGLPDLYAQILALIALAFVMRVILRRHMRKHMPSQG